MGIMAGFLLEQATTRPIKSVRKFFRNRIIASHPLYVLGLLMLFSTEAILDLRWQAAPGAIWKFVQGYYGYTPVGGVLWFLLSYNVCLLLFPWMHDAMNTYAVPKLCTLCAISILSAGLWVLV